MKSSALSRRSFLGAYVRTAYRLGLTGLCLRPAIAAEAAREPHADAVIHIFLPGGVPQQDSFDPKPTSPPQYRGELGSIATRLPGTHFSSLFPKTATVADRIAVIRSMSHVETDHDRGKFYMYSGARPNPALHFPSVGSIVAREFGPRNDLPPYVWYPLDPDLFPQSGFLSAAYNPFGLGADPKHSDPSAEGFRVRDLALPKDVDGNRLDRRRAVLSRINQDFAARQQSDKLAAVSSFYDQAYAVVTSPQAREAFEIDREPKAVRDRYGRNSAGQGLLLARRLVEAGVRYVSLNYPAASIGSAGAWDLHIDGHDLMNDLAPPIDVAYTTLIEDLADRGMLDRTLVILSTEFGRAPKINPTAGRDHWSKVFSVVLAGGGIKGGIVYGSSDATAAEPAENPVGVEDLTQTVYNRLGIDPNQEIIAPGDRPLKLVDGGRVLTELLV